MPHMPEFPPEQVTPFVFSDPSGKRWPRLRLILLIGGVLFFLGAVLFVQTLFVTPKMNVPFSLRQLKGQLRALQRQNPAGQVSPASLLWQKFSATRVLRKRRSGQLRIAPPTRSTDYACLPGMDDGRRWHGQSANRFRPSCI